jgi:uroporphyrin-3 C-methyltransferase
MNELIPQARLLRRPFWRQIWFWLALLAVCAMLWQWWATRARLAEIGNELAWRLAENARSAREDRRLLEEAQKEIRALQGKVGALETKADEFQGQADALRSLYQEAATSRDDVALAEAEQNVNIAMQQLQLSGNVQAATVALAAADERLARQGSLQFLPLRRTLARDLEALRATPSVDVPGMNLRLENLIARIDTLPLVFSFVPQAAAQAATQEEDASWWKRLLREGWREIRSMVRIQRFDRQEPVLLSQEQSLILRENIKLRLLNARLALLSRDQWTFRNELKAAHAWIGRYFNTGEKLVESALQTLEQLSATEIMVEVPSLNASLSAVQTLKTNRERR